MQKDGRKTKPAGGSRSEADWRGTQRLPRDLRARPWHRAWPRYYRWYRSLGFDRLSALWHALLHAGGRPQAYRRGPPR